jgi:toxin ParE1/3/4
VAGVSNYYLLDDAEHPLDEIIDFTRDHWGEAQAIRYFQGMVAKFIEIASRQVPWRAVPAEFGVVGFFCRYERHFIYWRILSSGEVGIVAILHERMHQIAHVQQAFEG